MPEPLQVQRPNLGSFPKVQVNRLLPEGEDRDLDLSKQARAAWTKIAFGDAPWPGGPGSGGQSNDREGRRVGFFERGPAGRQGLLGQRGSATLPALRFSMTGSDWKSKENR